MAWLGVWRQTKTNDTDSNILVTCEYGKAGPFCEPLTVEFTLAYEELLRRRSILSFGHVYQSYSDDADEGDDDEEWQNEGQDCV